jgi:hypothetical protein
VIIKIRDREFKIELVNNYVRKLYSDIRCDSEFITDQVRDAKDLLDEFTENESKAKTPSESRAIKKEYREKHKEIRIQIKELEKRIVATRNEILLEILSTNSYDYNEKWWDHKTDVNDINEFIRRCFDIQGTNKGKKKATKP